MAVMGASAAFMLVMVPTRWVAVLAIGCMAAVLARHRINLQQAKVTTLGERVEDTFLINGPELQHNKAQIETELLEALAA